MHNRQRYSPSCAPRSQRAKRQRQYRIHESLRLGAKQSAAVADCIDPRNIIPRPFRLFVSFTLQFVGRDHPLPSPRSSPTPASSRAHFLSSHRPHHRAPFPSRRLHRTVGASTLLPLQGPPEKPFGDLRSRISVSPPLLAGVVAETDRLLSS